MDASQKILTAPMGRLCWSLSLPAIAGLLLLGAATFADAAFVGQLAGTQELAAILIAFPVSMTTSALAALFGSGAAALASRALGEDDRSALVRIGGGFVGWSLLASLVLAVVVIACAPLLLAGLGARGEVLATAVSYTRIIFVGTPFAVFVFGASFLIRAEGRIGASMAILGGGSLLNVVLDGVFVGVLRRGAVGAAWATLITMLVTALVTAAYLAWSGSRLEPRRWRPTLSRPLLTPMLRDGVAPMLLYVLALLQQAIVFAVVSAWGGPDDVVFIGAFLRVAMLAAVPLWGVAMALQPVVGMNFGAANGPRVRRAVWVFGATATALAMVAWALASLLPALALGMFIRDATLIAAHVSSFRLLLLSFPTLGVQLVAVALLIGVGRGMSAALILTLRNLVILVPLALLLPYVAGLDGVWWALLATDGCCFVIALLMTRHLTTDRPRTP